MCFHTKIWDKVGRRTDEREQNHLSNALSIRLNYLLEVVHSGDRAHISMVRVGYSSEALNVCDEKVGVQEAEYYPQLGDGMICKPMFWPITLGLGVEDNRVILAKRIRRRGGDGAESLWWFKDFVVVM